MPFDQSHSLAGGEIVSSSGFCQILDTAGTGFLGRWILTIWFLQDMFWFF